MVNWDEQGVEGSRWAALKEAMLYHRVGAQDVICDLCAHRCAVGPGQRGVCGVRVNHEGRLYTLVFDRIVAMAVEPVERHSFYHVDPGSAVLALATVGCTMRCRYCLNYTLSQLPKGNRGRAIGRPVAPTEIVASARAHRCSSIAYTYTEPTVAFELMYETARLAHAQGVKNLLVTNGYLTDAALRLLAPYLDAAAIDLKGFDEHRYQECCGARLEPVLDTIRRVHDLGIWVEVTTLVVPGHNDSDAELYRTAEFLASLSRDIPWHVAAFFPSYQMEHCEPTPLETLYRACAIGHAVGLRYVYCGNIPGSSCAHTYCPRCRTILIERQGYHTLLNRIANGRCCECDQAIAGVALSAAASGHSHPPRKNRPSGPWPMISSPG